MKIARQFSFADIQKIYTQMEIPQRGIMLFFIRSNETWTKIGSHKYLSFKFIVIGNGAVLKTYQEMKSKGHMKWYGCSQ